MPFPSFPRAEFPQNTLEEVICQVSFPAVLSISTHSPSEFQERIRERYPRYSKENPVSVPPQVAQMLRPFLGENGEKTVHRFRTSDEVQMISLASEFTAISTSQYRNWANFSGEIELSLNALGDVYKPAFVSRVGLRYRNVIDREQLGLPDRTWRELINPDLLGLAGHKDVHRDVQASAAEVLLRLGTPNGGVVRVRHGTVRRENGSEGLDLYLIDADFYVEEETTLEQTRASLEQLHEHTGNLFRWFITDTLAATLESPAA